MSIPWEAQGYALAPVLLMEPHLTDGRPNALGQQGEVVEIPQGSRFVDSGPAKPTGRIDFQFRCETRAEVAFIEGFFDGCKGKHGGASNGFWFPTWQWEHDFLGYDEPNAGQYDLYLRRTGYVERFFPLGSHYRQLAILWGDRYVFLNVEFCTAAITATADKLRCTKHGGSSPIPPQVFGPLANRDDAYRMLWLRWGRFDQDECPVETINAEAGSADLALAVIELPDEAPVV